MDLKQILDLHSLWLKSVPNGKRANLRGADLQGANLQDCTLPNAQIIPEKGSFTAFKKLKDGLIAELYVPKSAQRVGGLLGRKCRVSKVKVHAITKGSETFQCGVDQHSGLLKYEVGKWVKPDKFDEDIRLECTHGIHVFITKKEAEEY